MIPKKKTIQEECAEEGKMRVRKYPAETRVTQMFHRQE
jgi:hypothetical protein